MSIEISRREAMFGTAAAITAEVIGSTLFAEDAQAKKLEKHAGGYFVADKESFLPIAKENTTFVIDARRPQDVYKGKGIDRVPENRVLRFRSDLDPINEKAFERLATHKGKVVIYCLQGGRSAILAQFLSDRFFECEFISLEGGLESIHGKMENSAEIKSERIQLVKEVEEEDQEKVLFG